MTMAAGVGVLLDETYTKENCRKIMENREWTQQQLKEMGFVFTDSKANFIFAMHPKADGKEIYLRLKKKGVLIRHFDTPRLCQYNRITVGSREQMEVFIAKLKEVLEELK
jgi:histidinol-phosphate aminotransferase